MKEFLYLWIKEYIPKDDFGFEKKYQIENQGISLSSKYNIKHSFKKRKESCLEIRVKTLEEKPINFFSEDFVDIKALVGRNGTGKTTILKKLLYRIVEDNFADAVDNEADYVLVYAEKGNVFYYKSTHLDCSCKISLNGIDISKSIKKNISDIKSERAIFFSLAFSTSEPLGGLKVVGDNDLSTIALLNSDNETLHNISMKFRKNVEKGTNFFNSHYTMELIRKVIFIAHFYEEMANNPILKFRLPNGIIIAPSNIDIENAIIEITDGDKKEIKRWTSLNKKLKSFNDRFRFAALLNHVRADLSNSHMRNFVEKKLKNILDPEKILENGIQRTIEMYAAKHIVNDEKKFPFLVENALKQLEEISGYQNVIFEKHPFANKDSCYFDLNNKSHRIALEAFINVYMELIRLTPFLFMNMRTQSSGEDNFIELFSRLYFALYMRERLENQNKSNEQRKNSKPPDIHLIIDEADLYLHLEWQRNWLLEFTKIVGILLSRIYYHNHNKPKIQLFISTHSPFIITDFPKDNIVLLDLNKDMRTDIRNNHNLNPFGANLYDLLSNGFFLKNSIGSFSEKLIEDLVRYKRGTYKSEEGLSKEDVEKKMKYVKESIGDSIVKSLINEMKDMSKVKR